MLSGTNCVLFLKQGAERQRTAVPVKGAARRARMNRIRCPRCGWEPGPHDRWMCVCAHVWNTFDTGGICPACERKWVETQCLRCQMWSRHEDWYGDEPKP
jgi:hypothetical protein